MSTTLPPCPRCGGSAVPASLATEHLDEPPEALARPEAPTAFSLMTWLVLLVIPGVNILSIFVSPLTRGLKAFIGTVATLWVAAIVWGAAGTFADPFAARDAAMMVGATTLVLYFIALLHSWLAERREVRAVALPAYLERVGRWERMAWCGACGTVFLDDSTEADATPAGVASLLGPPVPRPTRIARTPIWMWALLSAIAVWGMRTALVMAPLGAAEEEVPADPSPELWEDIEADRITPGAGPQPGDPLDRPLVPPPSGS